MGMVIKTNIQAINAHRNLNINNKKSASSLEKLASGFKINRAGDNASGLAISEKMKAQIAALGKASENCEDSISFIQTAEGYMEEIHSILNRMVELAEKSANGILEDSGKRKCYAYGESGGVQNAGTDRAALQMEMDQLCTEIDRIALTANFNGNRFFYPDSKEIEYDYCNNLAWGSWEREDGSLVYPYNDFSFQIGETSNKGDKLVLNLKFLATDSLFFRHGNYGTYDIFSPERSEIMKEQCVFISNSSSIYLLDTDDNGKYFEQPFKGNLSAHVWGCILNISDQTYASKVAEVVRNAIDEVSLERAKLGAMQNRLEYTISNLDTAKENIQSANSRIRDTDMAKEMMSYTQNNVLTQAAQAMLAQANTQPQSVLQLLQ